jgi:hypothetical protein
MGGQAMMTLKDRQPIIVADTGPLIRLAAAGLLDTMRGLNRRVVMVDRVREEATVDLTKPFAKEIADWIVTMGDTMEHVVTLVGTGIRLLEQKDRTPQEDILLKRAKRNSGEAAIREFVGDWRPTESSSAIVIYEDARVAVDFLTAEFSVTVMTTRSFANLMVRWGINVDARALLESKAARFTMMPARSADWDEETPPDMRMLPQDEEPT